MYAVIRTGGKQYKVAKNDVIRVEKLAAEAGKPVSLDEVLLLGDGGQVTVGAPLVDGASVAAEVLDQRKDKKVLIFKKKRRHNYRRKRGHRQEITVLRITDILAKGAKKPAAKAKAAPKAEAAPEAGGSETGQTETGAAPAAKED